MKEKQNGKICSNDRGLSKAGHPTDQGNELCACHAHAPRWSRKVVNLQNVEKLMVLYESIVGL